MPEILAQQAETTASGIPSLLIFAVIALVFYAMVIRPQKRRQAEVKEIRANLEVGTDVRTIGGIFGRIVEIDEETVVLEVEAGRIRVARAGIAGTVEPGA